MRRDEANSKTCRSGRYIRSAALADRAEPRGTSVLSRRRLDRWTEEIRAITARYGYEVCFSVCRSFSSRIGAPADGTIDSASVSKSDRSFGGKGEDDPILHRRRTQAQRRHHDVCSGVFIGSSGHGVIRQRFGCNLTSARPFTRNVRIGSPAAFRMRAQRSGVSRERPQRRCRWRRTSPKNPSVPPSGLTASTPHS